MERSLLFVCTANICRSPMAEGLFSARVAADSNSWRIASAGVYAQPGYPAAYYTLEVLNERGIGLGDHRSKPISSELMDQYNLILTMEQGQKEALRLAFPQHARKIFLLSEMGGEYRDIVDPVGGVYVDYLDTAREIETFLNRGFDRIYALAGQNENKHGE
jgi:protein-tyrosine-phosphatase